MTEEIKAKLDERKKKFKDAIVALTKNFITGWNQDTTDNYIEAAVHNFTAGAQALEEILLEESREFDPDAIRGACCAYILKNKFTMNNIEAAHWQFNQLQPIIQAQKLEIDAA